MLPPHNVAFATRMSRSEQPPKPDDISLERHYTVDELAELWKLSRETVRRLFQDVPGVLEFGVGASYGRPYITLRIPESVVIRRHRQLSLGRDGYLGWSAKCASASPIAAKGCYRPAVGIRGS